MGDFTVALNPPKTFRADILLSTTNNRTSPAARGFQTVLAFKPPRAFRGIRASVMPREGQQASLGDALVNTPRRSDFVEAIRRTAALSNCLSETSLHATVPGLESKTRGKVWNDYLFVRLFIGIMCHFDWEVVCYALAGSRYIRRWGLPRFGDHWSAECVWSDSCFHSFQRPGLWFDSIV